jgi:hypothetical protein
MVFGKTIGGLKKTEFTLSGELRLDEGLAMVRLLGDRTAQLEVLFQG